MEPDESEQWKELYRAAILEADSKKLAGCIKSAEQAIRARLLQLEQSPADPGEKQLMYDALQTLNNLSRISSCNDPSRPR